MKAYKGKSKMRVLSALLVMLSVLMACNRASEKSATFTPVHTAETGDWIFQPEDKQILDTLFRKLSAEEEASTAELVVRAGEYFMETPYVAHTLEKEKEQLVINLREMDCTTFAENCLAVSRTMKSGTPTFDRFASELQQIRYRDGELEGYASRLHYFSDWIHNNEQKNLVLDVSDDIAGTPFLALIDFMSSHPDSYAQLKNDSSLVDLIAEQEQRISTREQYFIPENRIDELESALQTGDIAGITTSIDGLDIQHVVILLQRGEHVHFMHASSKAGKVVVSENTLSAYLKSNQKATGIMVARPL
jgi:hypothetical protein